MEHVYFGAGLCHILNEINTGRAVSFYRGGGAVENHGNATVKRAGTSLILWDSACKELVA